jgi:hypothetical protein
MKWVGVSEGSENHGPVSPIPPAEPLTAGSIARQSWNEGMPSRRGGTPYQESRVLTQAFWERKRGFVS